MKTLNHTEKLERLSQKEIIRFYTYLMQEQQLNPQKFYNMLFEIIEVNVNDEGLMTNVQIKMKNISGGRSFIYRDNHAKDYSCSHTSMSPYNPE